MFFSFLGAEFAPKPPRIPKVPESHGSQPLVLFLQDKWLTAHAESFPVSRENLFTSFIGPKFKMILFNR